VAPTFEEKRAVSKTHVLRSRARSAALVAGLTWCAVTAVANGPGHSFTSLQSPFSQELYGVTATPVALNGTDGFLGSVAFTSDGNVWAAACIDGTTRLHRFDRQATTSDGHGGTVHVESLVDPVTTYSTTPLGCGMVNHPDPLFGGKVIYINSWDGLWPVDAETGLPTPLDGPINSFVFGGNGRGISVDPVVDSLGSHHVVYAGLDCDPSLSSDGTCTLWDFSSNAAGSETIAFARFNRSPNESVQGVYFVPNGSVALVSYRNNDTNTQGLAVIGRPAAPLGSAIDDSQVLRRITMASVPVGVAFRAAGDFAVTANEDGTMTQLVFPSGDFTAAPAQSSFASGGFRGGLMQVGADGCVYVPQGRIAGGNSGVRFGDDAVSPSDSVVRICGGFAPAPGVAGAQWSPEPGSISGAAFADWNRNGVKDSAEPGLTGVGVTLSGPSTGSAVTDASGSYTLANVSTGLYSVSAPVTVGMLSGNPTPLSVDLAPGQQRTGVDFPYSESTAPVCTVASPSGTPTSIAFTLSDAASGLRRIRVRAVSNFQVTIAGGAPVSGPATVDFPTPAAGNVNATAMRVNAGQAASVELEGEDAFGTQVVCTSSVPAPTPTPPPPPPGDNKPPVPPGDNKPPVPPGDTKPPTDGGEVKTIRRELVVNRSGHDVAVVERLDGRLRYITVRNGKNGLRRVEIKVNHRRYHLGPLRDGQVASLDLARALVPGKKNKIVLVGEGRRYESAVVTISSHR
jgi:hypothetical protein